MGATGWSYLVPYQPDVNQALQQLREQVFKNEQYEKPDPPTSAELDSAFTYLASLSPDWDWETTRREMQDLLALSKTKRRRKPKTIKGLLRQCGEEGTHSILDIERISSAPEFGAICPLPSQHLLAAFNTEHPDH